MEGRWWWGLGCLCDTRRETVGSRRRKEPVCTIVSPPNQFSSGRRQQQLQWRKVESKKRRRHSYVGNISHHKFEPHTNDRNGCPSCHSLQHPDL
ncbi:hypothetical protein CHARACLAT_022355 [Characodon lateralis]|uniref:Uncharacterized protein n=1 Tax=Characodon lateralis TaxID=208331 RepID=A0ABU7D9T8_9TELE|nr:hypothetical protein [Characodon lateralis]